MRQDKVPNAVVQRLPGYYRYLSKLEDMGLTRISSQSLGDRMGLTASQIRQDINCFGGFGQQGYGYNIAELRKKIGEVLGITREYDMVIAGAGHIGQALANYAAFREMGFCVRALFDTKLSLVGKTVAGMPVLDAREMPAYLKTHSVDIGVITVPAFAAQRVLDAFHAGGVKGVWNFAPVELQVPEGVALRSVHLSDALLVLTYHMQSD